MDENDKNILLHARKELNFLFELLPDCDFGVAGGSVVRLIYKLLHGADFEDVSKGETTSYQDYDIFPQNRKNWLKIRNDFVQDNFSSVTKNKIASVEYTIDDYTIDLVEPNYIGCKEVIKKFDILPCGILVARDSACTLRGAINCIRHKTIAFNSIERLSALIMRVAKYSRRGFDVGKADMLAIERCISDALSSDTCGDKLLAFSTGWGHSGSYYTGTTSGIKVGDITVESFSFTDEQINEVSLSPEVSKLPLPKSPSYAFLDI